MINFATANQPTMRDMVVEIKNVNKHDFGATPLRDISFSVTRGEIVALLGPASSGKTAILRLIAGLDQVASGEIYLSDNKVDSGGLTGFVPPIHRNVGLVLRSYAIWPHMTVANNASFPLAARRQKGPDVRQTVSTILEQVGLGGMEQRPASQLDQREQLLLAIARSLATSPDLVLLDEPLAGLSAADRHQMRGDLRILQRKVGVAMLIATQDEIEALSLSDRTIIMEGGAIKQVGTPADLYHHPSSEDIRDRMGRTLTFSGRIEGTPGKTAEVKLFSEDGPTVQVGNVHGEGLEDGRECRITVRPEAAEVVPMTEAPTDDVRNVITGIIAALLFVGDCYETTIELPRGGSIRLDLPVSREWREGQPVAILLRAADMHLWPDTPESPAVGVISEEVSSFTDPAEQAPKRKSMFGMKLARPSFHANVSLSGLTRRFSRKK